MVHSVMVGPSIDRGERPVAAHLAADWPLACMFRDEVFLHLVLHSELLSAFVACVLEDAEMDYTLVPHHRIFGNETLRTGLAYKSTLLLRSPVAIKH